MTSFYAATGVRLGVDVPLGESPLALGAHADLLAPLTRLTLTLDNHDVWKTPPLSGSGGLDLVGHF
jgi:hypothetical protein